MAFQAFFIRYFISQDVALSAVGHSFQVGMRLGQVSRGNLAKGVPRQEDCPQEKAGNKKFYHLLMMMSDIKLLNVSKWRRRIFL
jgi:hypothetical protein